MGNRNERMNYPSGASTFLTHNGTTFWIVPERDSQPAHCVLRVAHLHGMALVRPLSSNVSPISDVPQPTVRAAQACPPPFTTYTLPSLRWQAAQSAAPQRLAVLADAGSSPDQATPLGHNVHG